METCFFYIMEKMEVLFFMVSEAQKRAQKEANKKSLMFSANYRLNDLQEGKRLKAYLETTGQSANAYLKELIKKDLDSKGV